jgi:hypothetical protein
MYADFVARGQNSMGDRLSKEFGWAKDGVGSAPGMRMPFAVRAARSEHTPGLGRRTILAAVALGLVALFGTLEFGTRLGLRDSRLAGAPVPFPHDLAKVSFAVAGDVIPHEAVRAAAAADGEGVEGWSGLFNEVSDIFRSADFGFVNLETPVAPSHSHGSKPFMFDAPVALPEALKANGIRVELGRVGMLPVWGENNRNDLARGKAKAPSIHPVLIDREMPRLQAKLDELSKATQNGGQLTPDQKKEFIEATSKLKLLDDRRRLVLARTGDEYVTDPPKLAPKP